MNLHKSSLYFIKSSFLPFSGFILAETPGYVKIFHLSICLMAFIAMKFMYFLLFLNLCIQMVNLNMDCAFICVFAIIIFMFIVTLWRTYTRRILQKNQNFAINGIKINLALYYLKWKVNKKKTKDQQNNFASIIHVLWLATLGIAKHKTSWKVNA